MAVDIGALIESCPRKVHFWTKAELFKGPPGVKQFMEAMGCLPVKRNSRTGKKESNDTLFQSTIETLINGGVIAIFPEGTSHHTPRLTDIKDGAAWAALQFAAAVNDPSDYAPIVPAGIIYEPNKYTWRTNAHVRYGKPVDVGPFVDEFQADPRSAVKKLTAELREALKEVTINAPTWEKLQLAREAQSVLLGSEAAARDVQVINSFVRAMERAEPVVTAAEEQVRNYYDMLKRLQITDSDLELGATSGTVTSFLELLLQLLFAALATILVLPSFIIHFPAYLLLAYLSHRESFEESKAQIQIFGAHAVVPVTYAAWYIMLSRYLHPDSWSSTIWLYVILFSLGVTYLRAEDYRQDAYSRFGQSFRLLRAHIMAGGGQLEQALRCRRETQQALKRVVKEARKPEVLQGNGIR